MEQNGAGGGMKVVVTGGAGFLGRRVGLSLLDETVPAVGAVDEVVLVDRVPAADLPDDARLRTIAADIADVADVRRVIDDTVDGVFHLAAIVSGEAEADFDLGYRVNLDGTRNVLEACRALPHCPRVVYASSVAVYGGERVITDLTPLTPQTSYGAQKAAGELLLNDYTRKGFLDGRGLRLPTIVVRPGKPNRAASGFASSIIREPLQGQPTICPVTPETRMVLLSPRRVVMAFLQAFALDGAALGTQRTLLLGGIGPTIGEMVDALRSIGGAAAAARIDWQHDSAVQKIVDSWPQVLEAERAEALGFEADVAVSDIVSAFVEDELGGQVAAG